MDNLIDNLNGRSLIFQSQDLKLAASVTQMMAIELALPDDEFYILTQSTFARMRVGESEQRSELYSQRDPRWANEVYSGGATFGSSGCFVTCIAMIASIAGYYDDPPEAARKLRKIGCFTGAYLDHPENIPLAYPRLEWNGVLNWRNRPASLIRLREELEKGPVIIEVEFTPGGAQPPDDQHFVVAERLTDDGDLEIADPWDGGRTNLLRRYALGHWNLARSVYGARLLRKA